jgi:AsmA-like protein
MLMNERWSNNHFQAMEGRAVLILILLAGSFIAAALVIPLVLNMPLVRDAFLHEFEQRTGHRLTTERLDFHLLPRPRLDLRQVELFDRTSEAPLFVADRLDMALQIWPLFEGRVAGEYVVVERPRMMIRHDETGRWTIGSRVPEASSARTATPFLPMTVVRNVLITDGLVTIADEARSAQVAPLQLASLQATIAEEIPGRTARIQISGKIPQGAGSALFNVDGSLVLLHGADSTAETSESAHEVQVEGSVRIHKLDVRHMAGWLGMPPISTGFAAPAQLVAQVRLVPRPAGYDLIVGEWRAELSELSLQGTAAVAGLGSEIPRLSATLSASSVPLKQTLTQVPSEWIPVKLRDQLAEHAVDGIVTLYDTHVSGTLGDTLNVTGGMEIRDGRFLPGGTHPTVQDLSATVLYDLKQIRIVGLRANYGPVRLSEGTVHITDWKKEPTADVRISGEVPAAGLVSLLNDSMKVSQLAQSLDQFEQVTGDVLIVAHVAGRPMEVDGMRLVNADVMMRNVGFRHTVLPVPLRQVHGNVKVSYGEVRVESLHGLAGLGRVEVRGAVMLGGDRVFRDMTIDLSTEGDQLTPFLRLNDRTASQVKIDGPVILSVSVRGRLATPRFRGTLRLDGAAVDIPNVFSKVRGAPTGFRFDAHLTRDLVLVVQRCELLIPPIRLAGEAWIRLSEDMDFEAKIVSGVVSLNRLPGGVSLGPLKAGILKASLTTKGNAGDRTSWETTGLLSFSKGFMKMSRLPNPIRNISMVLRFDRQNIAVQHVMFNIGESDVRITGSIAHWFDAPRGKLVVESSQIDLQSLQTTGDAESSSSAVFPLMTSWWAGGRIDATLLIDHVFYQRFLVSGLSSHVNFERGVLTIDRISGDTNEGHVKGRLVVNQPRAGTGQVRSYFRSSGIPVDRLLTLFSDKSLLSGWLSATGKIQGEFERNRVRPASLATQRPIQIVIEDGHIYNVPLISKLLSVMNLPALLQGKIDLIKDGMPLDRLKVVMAVENGSILVQRLLLDSRILKISATGRYDYMDDEFDMVLVTSPMGHYAALLKSIPLFGTLFAGERQGFDTAIFEVKGHAKDPDLRFLPAESIATGMKGTVQLAFDLLVNAILLPAEAYSMTKDLFVDDDEGE